MATTYTPAPMPLELAIGGAAQFLQDGLTPNAVIGSTLMAEYGKDTIPMVAEGIRWDASIQELPDDITALELELLEFTYRRKLAEFTLTFMESDTRNVFVNVPARTAFGDQGLVWHAFPAPAFLAGGNSLRVEARRTSNMPLFRGQRINPFYRFTIVGRQLNKEEQDGLIRRNFA